MAQTSRTFILAHDQARNGAKTTFVSGVYAIINAVNGKVYIGSASNVAGRWGQHRYALRRNAHKNCKLQNAWSKYGEGNFSIRLVEEVCIEKLSEREQFFIDETNCVKIGYNIASTAGRERYGTRHSEESLEKMRKAHAGKSLSPEHKKKLSISFAGRYFSEETRAKISAAKTGKKRKPFSDQARANMSAAAQGRVFSKETREKLSAAHKTRWEKK